MTQRDSESQEIMAAAMRYVKSGDRTELESYSLSALKKADYQLGDRDINSGYRESIKDLISELIDNSRSDRNTELQKTIVERLKHRTENHPILAPLIIIGILVIGIGSFTDALDKIIKFIEPQHQARNATQYQSFKLGQEYFKPYIFFTQATVGPENKIKQVEVESIEQLKQVQGLADYLSLNLNIIQVAEKSKEGIDGIESIFKNKPWETISNRIDTIHGKSASASFRIGFTLPWLLFNSEISIEKSREYSARDREIFSRVYDYLSKLINSDLHSLDVNSEITWDGRDYKKLNASARKAWDEAKIKLHEHE